MISTPEELLSALDAVLPGFKKRWNKQDGGWSFSFCGLFGELTDYVRDNFAQMPEAKRRALMDFVESLLLDIGDQTYDKLDNAACTCFFRTFASCP